MRLQQYLLWAAMVAGIVAVVAGLSGFRWLAGIAAAILLVLFILMPWARGGEHDLHPPRR